MTVPVPLTDIEARRMPTTIQGGKTIGGINPIERDALCEALRIAVDIASEAVGRLGKIGNIYSLAYAADITETEALTQMEVALRGAPPEGDIAFYVLAERLAAVRELVDLGGDK